MRAILLGSVLLASLSLAHGSDETSFKLGAGLFVPTGDGSDFVTNGPRLSGMLGYKTDEMFELGFELAYNKYEMNESEFREQFGIFQGVEVESYFHIIELSIVPTVYLVQNEQMSFYGLVGAGMHFFYGTITMSDDFESETDSDSEQKFGVNFGGGLEFKAGGNLKIGMAPRYHVVFTKGDNTKYFTALLYLKF